MSKDKRVNRREFLSKTSLGAFSCGVLGISGNRSPISGTDLWNNEAENDIIYRILGKTGLRMPVVNMGVMNSMNDALVKRSYDIGVRYFDTAAWYQRGKNEEMVSQAIEDLGIRDEVIIGTKVYFLHPQRSMPDEELKNKFLEIANQSLNRLKTGHVDILYLHEVRSTAFLNNPGIREALRLLKQEGKARFIGFTTHTNMAELIENAAESGFYDVIETAFNYAMRDDESLISALNHAESRGIGLVAMKTQCAQYWYREYVPGDKMKYYEGSIMHTAVLKWVLRHPFITTAIPGYTTFDQMEEDFSVARDLEYTEEEKRFLNDRGVQLSLGYCRQCDACTGTCPSEVRIASLMRAHLYTTCYTNFHQAKDALAETPDGRGLDACTTCEKCMAWCKNGIDISKRIEELKMIYC